MFVSLSEEQQKELAKRLVSFLSRYKHISDSYIIEFFSENLWETLPTGWQKALEDLTAPQVAELLLDNQTKNRVYPTVWPLSLLALRATAHTFTFPRMNKVVKADEFHSNSSQSSLLKHIFRKHVKPKKQHEILKLGMMVKQLCEQTQCSRVVDVGSGQGHLTRFLSFGLGLNVTAIEADSNLVSTASKFDGQLQSTLAKESQRSGIVHTLPDATPRHVIGWVNPRDTWRIFLQQLGKDESHCENDPDSAGRCKKRQRVSMSPDKECEPETELVHKSQHVCGGECRSVADGQNFQSNSETPEAHFQAGFVSNCCCKGRTENHIKKSVVLAHSNTKEPSGSDFILTGLHACGDLSATLLRHFASCPNVRGITSVACCYMKITTKENPTPPGLVLPAHPENMKEGSRSEYGYPMSEWVGGLPGHQLSYKAREGACHAIEDYLQRLREDSGLLKTHCYRAALETIIRAERPELRRAGVQTVKRAHTLPFSEYARLGLSRVGLPADLAYDSAFVDGLLEQHGRVVVYFSLALLLAPVVESLVLLDRMLFLQERGFQSQLVPLFDPVLSPRNLVLLAVKPEADGEEVSTPNQFSTISCRDFSMAAESVRTQTAQVCGTTPGNEEACGDSHTDECQGWIRPDRPFFLHCFARKNITVDVDEVLWPDQDQRQNA